jgi:hypothetical protein
LSAGLLAAASCWALQGWLPPGWALFGAFIGLDLCVFSYWERRCDRHRRCTGYRGLGPDDTGEAVALRLAFWNWSGDPRFGAAI